MNYEDFKNELIKFEGEESVVIKTNDNEYEITKGSCIVGGLEETYESDLLGHVAYDNLSNISLDLYNYITKELNENIVEIDIY